MADNKTSIVLTAEDRTGAAIASTKKALGGLAGAAGSVDSAFSRLTGIGSILGGLGAGLSVAGVASFLKGVADSGDAMNDLSQRTGFAVESLSKYQYAAKLSDLTNEELESSLGKLNKSIGSNSDAFGKIGINLKDSNGGLKDNAVVLEEVAEKFAMMKDGAQKAAIAQELFGKSGAQMIPFLNQGKAGLAAMGAEAERLGLVMSSDLAAKSAKLNDSLDTMGAMFNAIRINVGGALIPMLAGLAEEFVGVGGGADKMSESVRAATQAGDVKKWAQSAASAAAFVVDGFKGVSAAVRGVAITMAASAAQFFALRQGNLAGVQAIGEQWQADMAKLFTFDSAQIKVDQFFENFDKTVTISGQKFVLENAEQAKTVQDIYDKFFAAQKKAQQNVTAVTDEQLKLRDQLNKKFTDEQMRRELGERDFAIAKIRERYDEQLKAIRGLENEAALRADLEKKAQAEIDDVVLKSAQTRAAAEPIVTGAVEDGAKKRLDAERAAAAGVEAVWSQANAVKAAASASTFSSDQENLKRGGVPRTNADGSFAFVSSWDANNNYIGTLGSTSAFASGGSFMVGGAGGTDSQVVAFRASPDERVTIETPAQQRAAAPGVTINVNVANGNPSSIVAAIKQALRTDPNLFTPGFARAG